MPEAAKSMAAGRSATADKRMRVVMLSIDVRPPTQVTLLMSCCDPLGIGIVLVPSEKRIYIDYPTLAQERGEEPKRLVRSELALE